MSRAAFDRPDTRIGDHPIAQPKSQAALVDRMGRVHRSLRVSVTDVCNIRCQYCMPADHAQFMEHESLLSFELIERFVREVVPLGISNLRLTGGEPLLRRDLHQLVGNLAEIPGLQDLALTTNGMLLADHVESLAAAGLRRINISLDTLSEDVFYRISRRKGLEQVLAGIDAALAIPAIDVKLNALVLRDVNFEGVLDLVQYACQQDLPLRFIEFMPLDAERAWNQTRMVSGDELRQKIAAEIAPLKELVPVDPARPARDFVFADGRPGQIGFIDSVSKPFCGSCDRLRMTADGKLRNCLFGVQEWDVAAMLRGNDTSALKSTLAECVRAKHPAHGIADPEFQQPDRPMYQIGG